MANVISTVLKLDATQLKTGLKSAQQSIKETDGIVAKARTGFSSMWASFTSSPIALAGAGAAIGAFASKAINDASNLEESINAVNVAFGGAAEGVHALGAQSAESVGLSERAFNELSVQLSGFTDQIAAGSGRDAVGVLDELTTRIADFASVNNLDVAEAARIFQSSLAGETEALRRFGGDVSAAAVETFALENGLAASKAEITESIKVQARYGLLMEETAKTAGDFANTQDGLANQQRILSANVEDLSASFGQKLVPIMADAAGTANNLISSFEDLSRLAPGGTGGPVGGMISGLVEPFTALQGAMDGLERATGFLDDKLGESEGELGTFALVMRNITPTITETGEVVVGLGEAVDDLGPRWSAATIPLEGASGAFAEMQSEADRAADAVEESGEAADEAATPFEILANAVNAVKDAMDAAFSDLDDDLEQMERLADIEEQFANIADAETMKDAQTEIRRLIGLVADYVQGLDDIPPQKVSEIIAVLRTGDVDAIRALMDDLTKDRFINVGINVPQAGFESIGATFNPASGVGPTPVFNGLNPQPTQSAIPGTTIINNYPVGTTPTTQFQDLQTDARRNGIARF